MRRSKVLICALLVAFIGLLFCGLNVNASTTISPNVSVVGAQVRTSGTAGIRFVGKVDESYDKTNVTAYGIAIAFGETASSDVVVDGNVNGKNVISAQVSELDGNNYYINLIDIPNTMYGQKVTTRAYVVDNGEIIYADTAVTRSLGQVTLSVKAADQTSELIEQIVTELNTNYKNVYTDANGNIFVGNGVYEINPANLEKEFVKDWNAKFGTTWTEVTISQMVSAAANGFSANTDIDPSLSDLFKFFRSEEYQDKWIWLLELISFLDNGSLTWPMTEANAIINYDLTTSTNSNTTSLYKNHHLAASISNFFNSASENIGYRGVYFSSASQYKDLGNYNDQIYASDATLVKVGNSIELANLNPDKGYTFDGYNTELYNNAYTVTSESIILKPQYTAIDYSIKYYNGSEELTSLGSTYNVEDDVTLAIPEIEGYDFEGWYEDSSFSGEAVTDIAKGTTGNKVYYAKTVTKVYENVNVTFDANGGTILPNSFDIPASSTLDVTKWVNFGSDITYMYTKGISSTLKYQNKILLNYDSSLDLYEVIAIDAATKTLTDAAGDKTWTHFISNSAVNITTGISVGQYVYIDAEALQAGTTQTAKVYDVSSFSSFTTQLKDPCTLPTPTKDGYTFTGWKSSVDNAIITQYPGYKSNPGAITYTAQYSSGVTYTNVNVTYDPNGGFWDDATIKANITASQQFTITRYNTYDAVNGYTASIHSSVPAKFWKYICLVETEFDGIYEITQIANGSANVTAAYDLVIMWFSGNTETNNTALNAMFSGSSSYLGDYVLLENLPTGSSSSCSITVTVFEASEVSKNISKVYSEPTTLLTPVKTGYDFLGWKSSLDGSVVTTFPGYGANPGNITYTAQWEAGSLKYAAELAYETTSYVNVNETINLLATYAGTSTAIPGLTWSSNDTSIATVNSNGQVTGVGTGYTTIRAALSSSNYVEFGVTVINNNNMSSIMSLIIDGHQSNVFTSYNLGIGAGTPVYYYDVIGNVNDITFNESLVIDNTYLATGNAAGNNSGTMSSVQFITVHYTGNMSASADAAANASYFVGSSNSSIHYTTGNDGVYHCMDDNKKAWHAGATGTTTWTKTSVAYSASDPKYPVFGINSNSMFTLNGKSTGITVPNETTRGYGYVTESKWLNDMGLAWKVEGGYYYVGNTYWCYSQVYEGRICAVGGNNNSIGIESCVNQGSDLMYTWQKTAQLCAKLLNENNLEMNYLVGHHFFTAKDCPQPMLENDLEIWSIFREMVENELLLLKNFSNYTISMEVLSGDVSSTGRVTQIDFSQICTYKVTVTNKTTNATETITLSSAIEGTNSK